MHGFEFRYRLSGKSATIKSFAYRNTETLSRGDMLNLEGGEVDLAATGDVALVGAADESLDGEAATTSIRVVADADAVYGIEDPRARLKGATLDLRGLTGDQGVGPSMNAEFVVDVDSSADEETLIRINGGRHYEEPASGELQEPLVGGELNAAIARSVVRSYAALVGRGPTKANAFYRDNVVVVLLQDVMTKGERTLTAEGKGDIVLSTRQAVQDGLRPYLRSTIERLTGCKLRASMSANSIHPDMAAQLFVLDRPVPQAPAQGEPRDIA
jgi:uncharacterized protein YbcI